MNGNRPTSRQWMQLTRGILLVSLLALTACSSDMHRQIPQASLEETRAATGIAKAPSSTSDAASSPDARKTPNPVVSIHSEEKSVSAGSSIFFSDGDTALSEDSKEVLRQNAEYLKQNPKRLIVLRAYLDSIGSRSFSLAIMQERLNAVVEMLREQGVPKSRVRQVMLGQRGKKMACETPSCQSRSQRIELIYK